jgi:3-deoxy-D-manno-octulosonic acid kinase
MKPNAEIQASEFRAGSCRILYDSDWLTAVSLEWLQPAFWQMRGLVSESLGGRGQALAVDSDSGPAVLRRYLRGGKLASLLHDRYLFTGYRRSRGFHEWRMLARLHAMGLPVPRPLAASCERKGLVYRAGLLTARIADARTLADVAESMNERQWQELLQTLRSFFDAGVVHADLNARNILIDGAGRWYLIDFDKARQLNRPADGGPMLRRLLRSCERLGLTAARQWLG